MSEISPRPRRLRVLCLMLCSAGLLGLVSATIAAESEAAPSAAAAEPAAAAPAAETLSAETVQAEGDHLWTLVAAILVFWMQAGFAMVEAGFTRAKNAANIMMKNAADMCFGALAFWIIGYSLMFGATGNGLFGTGKMFFSGLDGTTVDEAEMVFWIFQCVFCATAATIVSGAMAGRTNFSAYLCFSVIISALIYPVYGKWAWGSLFGGDGSAGWLEGFSIDGASFIDFAGSTVVHSIGGWCALAGAICVGPRLGKFDAKGKARMIPGHNLTYGMIGTFILWMGWFGFNAGSTTAIGGSEFSRTAVTTMLAACAGGAVAMLASRSLFGKWDLGITCNGVLGGLVAVTAPCYNISPLSAVIIGAIAGIIIPNSIMFFDKIKIDDPVGAISVHLVCGIWGTLSAGIFAQEAYGGTSGLIYGGNVSQVLVQLVGIAAAGAWAFPAAFVTFKLVDAFVGLRVPAKVEEAGLDVEEHGISAYPSPTVFEGASVSNVAS